MSEWKNKTLKELADIRVSNVDKKIHEGKTTFATNIAKVASEAGINVGGILAKAELNNNERVAYYAEDIKTGQTKKLITKESVKEYYDHYGAYFFLKDGMEFALKCLSLEYLENTNVVIIDEIGAMELEGRGYNKQLSVLLSSTIPIIILVIREQFIESICQKYNIIPIQIVRTEDSPEKVIKIITPPLA